MEGKEVDAFIMGRGRIDDQFYELETPELASLTGIIEKTIKAMNIKRLDFAELFGEGKTMKKRAFGMRMSDLGVSNHLRYSELVEALKVKKMFDTVDLKKFHNMIESVKDNQNRDQAADFKKAKEQIQEMKEFLKENNVNLGRLLARYDQDNSGDISPREFYILMNQLNPGMTRKEISDMFKVIDKDGNGTISKMEFEKVFSISMKDVVSAKVKSLSWASPHFAEMSYILNMQMRTLRDAFSIHLGSKKEGTIGGEMTIPK
jgi:Ca2+-binding EF-hand superfamily protein